MYKKANFLIFSMIFVAGGAFCQKIHEKLLSADDFFHTIPAFQISKNFTVSSFLHKKNYTKPVSPATIQKPSFIMGPVTVISADYYTANFGFFCKKELQFEKVTRVPFKFRLGSVQYCDWMEGKRTAGFLPDQ